MSIFRRRLMTNIKKSDLPSGYKKVKYLQSTGTQYFNLGITPKKNFGSYQKCSKTDAEANEVLFGCRNDSGQTRFMGFSAYRGDLSLGYMVYLYFNKNTYDTGTTNEATNIPYINNTVFEGWVNYKNDRLVKAKSENGDFDFTALNKIGSSAYPDLTTFTKPIYVFGYMNYTNVVTPCSCRIYDLEITDNEEVVSKLIPCLDNNNKPCMYDVVRKITFYNEGTGEFLYGN